MQLEYNIFGGCELFRHFTKFLYFLPPLCWGTLFQFFDFSFVKLSGVRVWVQVVLENCDGTVVGTGTGKSGTGMKHRMMERGKIVWIGGKGNWLP
jgi:hypothetical protein